MVCMSVSMIWIVYLFSSSPVHQLCRRRSVLSMYLVVTKVDYCSLLLSGISGQLLQRLQSVFNAAARLVFSTRKSEHIIPILRELHWLKVPERIQFQLCILAYRCLNSMASSYLAETLNLTANVHVGSCQCLGVLQCRHWLYRPQDAPHLVIEPSWWLCSSVECSSAVCSFYVIAAAVPPRPEDVTVPVIVLFTTVSSCVADCNFNIVRCSCNGPVLEVLP